MRFTVRHRTSYRYDVPVTLAPHLIRLTPRTDQGTLLSHHVHVMPAPVEQRELEDADGNRMVRVTFSGSCRELMVESFFELETRRPPSADTALAPLPWTPATWTEEATRPSVPGPPLGGLHPTTFPSDPRVLEFARAIASDASHDPLAFLDHLTHTLYSSFDRRIRPSGDANPGAVTLETRSGACRDLAVLFLEAAQSLGIPGRFVSGYQAQIDTVDGQRHLHAWPEVRLPGCGFLGWDPTHGVRVSDGHVALCAAARQADTMPIEGAFSFDGEVVHSTLEFSLEIDAR